MSCALHDSPSVLSISMFGSMSIAIDGVGVPPPRNRKYLWLLALLVLRNGRALDRSQAAGLMWPNSMEEQALYNLRRALSDLRTTLGAAADRLTSPTPRTIAFQAQPQDHIDVCKFTELLSVSKDTEGVEALNGVISLYTGPLLHGCDELWVNVERDSFEQSYVGALELLASRCRLAANFDDAASALSRAISIDPLRESLYRELMECHRDRGDFSAAIMVYRDLRLYLRNEINCDPSGETQALYNVIKKAGASPTGSAKPEKVSSVGSKKTNLPQPLTRLIGRATEIKEISQLIRDNRLVTLLGPGGIGKTRLAIEATRAILGEFEHGACFVDLASVSENEGVPAFIVAALSISEKGTGSAQELVVQYLRPNNTILVLDNCEHVMDACVAIAQAITQACPEVHIIATSREALSITGEKRVPVPSLAAPNFDTIAPPPNLANLLDYDAIELFVERGRDQHPGFKLTSENAAAVCAICTALDGLPLALELAAARLNLLSPDQIAVRLKDRFKLLTTGSRAASTRQQTLMGLIDWSHDLLNDGEKRLFYRLAIFSGGWELADAAGICSDDNDDIETLNLLTSLLEKSLVQDSGETAGVRRYRMLETIREYAAVKLRQAGEFDSISSKHATYYLRIAEVENAAFDAARREQAIESLRAHDDNMRAALQWCFAHPPDNVLALNFVAELGRYWYAVNRYQEGLKAIRQAIEIVRDADPVLIDRATNVAGSFCWVLGDFDEAKRYWQANLEYRIAIEDHAASGISYQNLGLVAMHQGQYTQARSLLEAGIKLIRQYGARSQVALPLSNLAIIVKDLGEYDYAHELLNESLQLLVEAGNIRGQASALVMKGNLERRQGRPEEALATMYEALRAHREIGELQGSAIALNNIGEMLYAKRDFKAATEAYNEAISIAREVGDRRQTCTTLFNLGLLLRDTDSPRHRDTLVESVSIAIEIVDRMLLIAQLLDQAAQALDVEAKPDAAVRFLGSIGQAVNEFGSPLSPTQAAIVDRLRASALQSLGPLQFSQLYEEGSQTSLENALRLALQLPT